MSGQSATRPGKTRPVAFISHHSSQVETARRLKRILDENGIGGWLAPDDVQPGRPFDQAIIEQVRGSDLIILLFCSRSDQSRHVKRELMMAENEDKLIYPVRLEEIEAFGLAYWLNDYQWVDWFDDKDMSIERMITTVKEQFGLPDRPPAPPTEEPADPPSPLPEPPQEVVNEPAPPVSEPSPPPPPPPPEPPPASAKKPASQPEEARPAPKPEKTVAGNAQHGDGNRRALLTGAAIVALLLLIALVLWLLSAGDDDAGEEPTGSSRLSPSVDCADLSVPAHELICGSGELAARERQAAAAYEAATAAATDDAARVALEEAQAAFVARRDSCDNSACIGAAYLDRLDALGASTTPPPPEPVLPQAPDEEAPVSPLPREDQPDERQPAEERAPERDPRRPETRPPERQRPAPTPTPPPPSASRSASAATPARPANNAGSWVTQSDYPSDILRGGESGTTRYQVQVGADGRPTRCFTTGTSGHWQLDARACRRVMARARFTPARDANGNATNGIYSGSFTWRSP